MFDDWAASDACGFIEKLPHVDGVWETPTIRLHDAHVFFVVQLFGFRRRNEMLRRRFTEALLCIGRKNAKSTLVAGLLLYCLCCEQEPGAQLINAAMTGDQAGIVFRICKRMVELTPALQEAFGVMPFSRAIARWGTGSTLRPINAKASTQDGLNPSHCSFDEIHAQKTHDLFNVLRSAAGARANPLWLYPTTEGYETPGPWPELRSFAERLLKRIFEADHFLALIFAVDEEDADFDESKWPKANPLMETNPVLAEAIRRDALAAQQMPGSAGEFRIKRLNRRASAARAWLDLERWNKCSGVVDLERLKMVPCWGGLDLSSTTDFNAFRLVWVLDGTFYTWGVRWAPASAVAYRTERAGVKYAPWVERGLLRMTDGEVTDYGIIERDIDALRDQFTGMREIAFDPWNATDLCNRLMEKNYVMVAFRQGAKSYHPAIHALDRAYRSRRIMHGGDDILRWNASNVVMRLDDNKNMAPDKKRSAEKIDDFCALLMALARALAGTGGGSLEEFLAAGPSKA